MNQTQADIQEIIGNGELFFPLKGKTILITGATGLIGSMLVKTFIYANEKYGLDIIVYGQIRNEKKAQSVFGDLYGKVRFVKDYNISFDYIIHTISPTRSKFFIEHPVETIKASVESTMEILEVAKNNKSIIVYLSSMEQYGVPYEPGQRMTENKIGVIDHLNIRSSYSESKRICECLCVSYAAEYQLDVRIARLAQTFGAGAEDSDNRMPIQFAKAVVEGKDIILHTEGKSVTNFVYLSDAITGVLTIMLRGEKGQVYNVCNDVESRGVREIAELVASDVAGKRISVQVERKDNMGYAPDVVMYLDSGKIRMLGWRPKVSMLEAYRRLVQYLEDIKK